MLQKTTDYKHAKNGHLKLSKNQLNVPDIAVFNIDTVGPCTYSDWSKAHVSSEYKTLREGVFHSFMV